MTREEILQILDTIPTIGERVNALVEIEIGLRILRNTDIEDRENDET